MNSIDRFLNSITMYRLVLYGLTAMAGWAFLLSLTGSLGYGPGTLAVSAAVIVGLGYGVNRLLAWFFQAAAGIESGLITALILFLVLKPSTELLEFLGVGLAVILALASKYLLAWHNRHVLNPAAAGLLAMGLLGSGQAFWWVGSAGLLPVVAVVGLLVVRKLRRFHMVVPFLVLGLGSQMLFRGAVSIDLARTALVSGPLLFFGMIMLTEPVTTPPTQRWRVVYGGMVGLLYGLHFNAGPLFSSPELMLVAGNLCAYVVSSKRRWRLRLRQRTELAPGVYEFAFEPDVPLAFRPGQYLEWTLPHQEADERGNRRFFTIASAPGEPEVKIAVRMDGRRSSSFKAALLRMSPGEEISAAGLGGDFTLPDVPDRKLVFIAGGIGITPFRSMIGRLLAAKERREVVLFYSANSVDDFVYAPMLEQARSVGVETSYMLTASTSPAGWEGGLGFLTAETIQAGVPEYRQAIFYLSGPNAMVVSYKKMLRDLRIPASQIRTDYFPGF